MAIFSDRATKALAKVHAQLLFHLQGEFILIQKKQNPPLEWQESQYFRILEVKK